MGRWTVAQFQLLSSQSARTPIGYRKYNTSVTWCNVFGLFWSKTQKIAYSHFNLPLLWSENGNPLKVPEGS
jgi:hypothetical protein